MYPTKRRLRQVENRVSAVHRRVDCVVLLEQERDGGARIEWPTLLVSDTPLNGPSPGRRRRAARAGARRRRRIEWPTLLVSDTPLNGPSPGRRRRAARAA